MSSINGGFTAAGAIQVIVTITTFLAPLEFTIRLQL